MEKLLAELKKLNESEPGLLLSVDKLIELIEKTLNS
jgi:hypothetical protein